MNNFLNQANDVSNRYKDISLSNSLVQNVFNWMGFALLITATIAYLASGSVAYHNFIIESPATIWILLIAEFGVVIWLSAGIKKMSVLTARLSFIAYAALNGLTFATIFWAYHIGTIYNAFFSSAVMFGVMSLYGYFTKKDLTSWGSFFRMGLIGIIIASILNMLFIGSPNLSWAITYLGVVIFLGLTAYDVQKIKQLSVTIGNSGEALAKLTILGALTLYLDFINLFLMLLRIFGRRD